MSAIPGMGPTALLNHYRFYSCHNSAAPNARGTLHSRYGGRGDHRHTSHFGGDVVESWPSLAFMVYFTKTAANAPACWWGHEMMRAGGGINDNSELFVRTNQFGAWGPIFTSWGNGGENNIWWDMPEPFASAMKGSLADRQQLLPYRYTLAAEAAATGVCPLRPMHFSEKLEPDAYDTPGQFMLGPHLLVAPALTPVAGPPIPPAGGGPADGTTPVALWVPTDTVWLDFNDPAARVFPCGHQVYNATIFVVPVLVRAGAVIPLLPRNYTSMPGISAPQVAVATCTRTTA